MISQLQDQLAVAAISNWVASEVFRICRAFHELLCSDTDMRQNIIVHFFLLMEGIQKTFRQKIFEDTARKKIIFYQQCLFSK